MKRHAPLIAILLAASLLISACGPSNLPPPQWHRVEDATVTERKFTPEGEYFLGRAVAVNILKRHGYYDNEKAGRYLSLLTTYMAYANDLYVPYNGYNVTILDTKKIYAFSAPGGHLLISRGLINEVGSEEELAGVIAHELGHLKNKDGIRSVGRSKSTSMLTAMGTLLVSLFGGGGLAEALLQTFEGAVNHAVTDLTAKGFSRQQEISADEAALGVMRRCGYPATAYLNFMNRSFANQMDKGGSIFSTHPISSERVEKIKAQLQIETGSVPIVPEREHRFNIALR